MNSTAKVGRWRQLSLRAFLTLVGLACLASGYFVNRLHRQRQVVSLIRGLGGDVRFSEWDRSRDQAYRRWLPVALGEFALRDIEEITLFFVQMSDAEWLSMLSRCPNLKRLSLAYSSISDDGLREVGKLSALRWLDLKHTRVTDVGLKSLDHLGRLESLLLDGAPVTDEGLPHLTRAPRLTFLSIRQTQVSTDGLRRFQQSAPHCHVVHSTLDGARFSKRPADRRP